MRCDPSAERRARSFHWGVFATLVVSLLAPCAEADVKNPERTAELSKLTAEQKDELLRKKERFDALPLEEKERLRKLHAAVSALPDSQELQKVLRHYSNWLNGLQSAQRAEVLGLPPDKRIDKIKEIVRQQEGQRFREYVNFNLPDDDRATIYKWLDQFAGEHEDAILNAIQNGDDRHRVRKIDDPQARRRALIGRLHPFDPKMPYPAADEIAQMVKSLSEGTRKELEKNQDPGVRQNRYYELVGAAIFSVNFPPPSEEELGRFYSNLDPGQRSRLDSLDPEQMKPALRKLFREEQYRQRGGPWGGRRGGRGGGPPRGGGFPPPGEQGPPGPKGQPGEPRESPSPPGK